MSQSRNHLPHKTTINSAEVKAIKLDFSCSGSQLQPPMNSLSPLNNYSFNSLKLPPLLTYKEAI